MLSAFKNLKTNIQSPFGLYVHIPFCAFACHYCDFAKSANYSDEWTQRYFKSLHLELTRWKERFPNLKFDTVFFGGGTPGLFTRELAHFLEQVPRSISAEVTLEANPANCSSERLEFWRKNGFNRISIGVQTLDPNGLKFLTRDHDKAEIHRAIEQTTKVFENINVDFIYGWPGQSLKIFQDDLKFAEQMGVKHVSLYTLTYEQRTPIGRKLERGLISPQEDTALEELYLEACAFLQENGWDHEEVSNWSKPGFSCKHNWLYWDMNFYLGVGAGAHSFMPTNQAQGIRFSNTRDFRSYIRGFESTSEESVFQIEDDRNLDTFILESISGPLRTSKGLNIASIEALANKKFSPSSLLQLGMQRGLIKKEGSNLRIVEAELFRENSWIIEMSKSFVEQS